MKRVLILVVLVFAAIILTAKEKENTSYITVAGKTYFGVEVKSGLFNTSIITTEGEVLKFSNNRIDAIMHDGKLYEKMSVISPKGDIMCVALMEYITSRDGLRLYHYCCHNQHCDLSSGNISQTRAEDYYFVYKDGKFHLRVDRANAAAVLPFFGIQVIQ